MKKRISLKLLAATTMLSAFAVIAGSVAWFIPLAQIAKDKNPLAGSSSAAYFAYGNGSPLSQGTEDRPYGITAPRHLYNLAWLQYIGYFNKAEENGKQYYFELGDNIDMTGWTLPPIGTEEGPFIGNFNGNGYVVKGLTISNSFDDFERHPSAVTSSNFTQPHILGFFGVVGDYHGDAGSAYSSAANEFINTGLTGLTIKTYLKDSLMGIAAGYVDANMKNVAVDASTITLDNSITQTTTSYGGYTNNISDFSLVGYTKNKKQVKKVDETIYDVTVSSGHEFNATEQGEGANGWGGSIDMMSVMQRLQSIRNNSSSVAFDFKRTYNYHKNNQGQYTKDTTYTANATMQANANNKTYIINNNDEHGHFNIICDSGYEENYALLGGGHYETSKYYDPANHTGYKITDGNNHYLSVTSFTNTSGTLANTTETNACVWSVPTGSSGKISTQYYYNKDNNINTYYLSVSNNGTLSLSTTQNDGATFARATQTINGQTYIRYTYNNRYLNFNGTNWVMTTLPTEPTVPVDPETLRPTEPTEPDYDAYLSNGYQIYYTSGSTTYYFAPSGTSDTGNQTSLSPSGTYGWRFESTQSGNDVSLENATSVYIYTIINNTKYYIDDASSSPYRYYLTTRNNAQSFTKGTSGDYYTFNSSGNYYICYDTSTHNFEDRTSNNNNRIRNLTVKLTRTILDDAYLPLLDQYNQDLATYNQYLSQYPDLLEQYNTDYANYISTTYCISSTSQTTNTGPDEHLVNTKTGMNYDNDDVTYFPLSTVNGYSDLRPADNNTAYVVAGSNITSSTTTNNYSDILTRVRFGRFTISGNLDSDYSNGDFTHVYTVNNSMQKVEITNDSSFEKLADAKKNLGGVLKKDGTYVYGLHFMDAAISMDALTTANYVKVNKVVHTNYQLPVNSINFHLKEFGSINFMAGTYFDNYKNGQGNSNERNDSFFALYQIERLDSDPTKINRIFEILNIYKHNSGTKNYSYVYQLKDIVTGTTYYTKPYKVIDAEGTKEWLYDTTNSYANNQYENSLPANYTLEFNCARIKQNSISYSDFVYHAFYFEIPMNDGEFCLGSVSGATGSYLMYLDIGANASKYQRTSFTEHFSYIETLYEYPEGVALVSLPETFTKEQPVLTISVEYNCADSACVQISGGYTNSFTIDRNTNDVTLTRTNQSNAPPVYAGEEITSIHDSGSSTNISVTPISQVTKDVERLTYYDVNMNLGSLIKTVITDTSVNNGTPTRTIVQSIYSGTDASATPTSTYVYDVSQSKDDRDSMKIYNTSNGVRYTSDNLINQSTLPIGTVSTTAILTVRIVQNGGNGYTEDILLEAIIDQNNLNGKYYIFKDYLITITPNGTDVVITVKSYSSGKTIYYGATQVTGANQTITIAV